ncbi:LTA synthase family protein [Methylobacterium sp. J-059]|uniref:LTA synthase family protein n=1 Tax=Methylobacterium sp. J-059 TaxID=2836643 RepID=UPI001FB9E927|nr:LTA synthase family protein [Methylobacterium sp. J-059]MCJ2040383.1 LTA synthase family protein [Methylobacterium sp. J-059]
MSFLLATVVAFVLCLAIEFRFGDVPGRASRRPGDLAIRLGAYGLILLFWFVFSWRPWLAASSCVLTVAILHLVSHLKRAVIGEPLVFSDFALLPQVPRHPQLYYVPPVTSPRIAVPLLLGLAGIALWYRIEPSLLPASAGGALAAVLGLPLGLAALLVAADRGPFAGRVARRFPQPELEADLARYGLPACLIAYALRWRSERGGPATVAAPAIAQPPGDDVVVVIQLESFLDPERLGGPHLPLMDLIRARASEHGRLRVPAHGAYTMRTEHAVLTGRGACDLGFGVFDPYLASRGNEPGSLARTARRNGYATTFVHPFHRDFFQRARVMEAFGFDTLVMEEAFGDAPRVGPYVGDAAFGERVRAEVAARRGPLFLFGVTMENHGPWKPGRLPGIDDPVAQYLHHVAAAGRMVEDLVAALAGLNATLCIYGDHAPALPTCRPGFGDTATDYALFRFGHADPAAPRRVDRTADDLGRRLRAAIGRAATSADGPSVAVPRS